jgi:hypothetical protein
MRTTVDLDASLLKRLRVEARRRGVSVKELLATLLRRGLEAKTAPKRFRVRAYNMGQASFPIDKALQFAGELEDAEVLRKLSRRK